MTGKSKTVHVIELKSKTEDLAKALSSLKNDFQGLNIPPELEKVFAKLENSISSILRKTEKGIIPREDFSATEKEVNRVKSGFDSLANSLESLKNLNDKKLFAMLPEDTVQKLNAAKNAYEAYASTLSKVVAAERVLEQAEEKKREATEKAQSAARSESAYLGKVTIAKKELEKHKEITEALEERAKAERELAEAQKDYEKAKKKPGVKESTLSKKAEVVAQTQARKDSADAVIAKFSKKDLNEQAAAQEKVTKAEEKYTMAKKATVEATKAQTVAEVAAQTASTDLSHVRKKSEEEAKKEAKAFNTLRNALIQVNPAYKNLTLEGKTSGEQLQNLKKIIDGLTDQELEGLRQILKNTGNNFDAFREALEKANGTLGETKEIIKQNDETLAAKEAFESKIKQFLGLSGAAQVLRSALRDAIQTITELDATMTEMAVVTDLTVGDYWDQLPEYSKRASELGVSINAAYEAATLYYQQGLKTNEVNAISAQTLKMAKIAGLDAATATDKMTAALRGFNMELNEASAQRVADVYSELAAITAADTKEIANAMTKTASIASSAGMEFETTAAFLAQIIETTRESAETAGTAMKTVIARFQELKKAPEDIGEVEGEIVDANAIETALRSVGVSLRDAGGQFRELDDVFLELSSKWDGLDKNTQRYIATIAAGSRQQSRFIAMMSDYSRTQELVNAANSSAGASNTQFEKTLDSLSSKLEKLQNAWHEFTMGIMNSDFVKFGIDVLTKFLEIVNKATSGMEGLGGSIVKIFSILTVFKLGQKIFNKIKKPIFEFFSDIVKEAGLTGEKSARAYQDGLERGKERLVTEEWEEKPGLETKQKKSTKVIGEMALNKVKEVTGFASYKDASVSFKKRREARDTINKIDKTSLLERRKKIQNDLDVAQQNKGKIPVKNKHGKKNEEFVKKEAEIAALKTELDECDSSLEKLAIAEKNFIEQGESGWKNISRGIAQTGEAIIGAGVALSTFGAILAECGLEEAGEGFVNFGNGVTMFGSAVSSLGPIVTKIVGALEAGGMSVQAAWGWVGAIIAAIFVLGTIIVKAIAEAEKNSPENKLKVANKAAQEAAKSAKEAADAYEQLGNSLEEIGNKQNELKNLAEGTREWKEAVGSLNSSILDLITEYPKLAGLITRQEDGTLYLDINSDAVQAVLQEAQNKKVMSENLAFLSKISVSRAQMVVDKKDFQQWISHNSYAFSEKDFDEIAKKLAQGQLATDQEILDYIEELDREKHSGKNTLDAQELDRLKKSIKDNAKSFKEFGEGLIAIDNQQQIAYDSLAEAAFSLADTFSYTEEQLKIAKGMGGGNFAQQAFEQEMEKLDDFVITKSSLSYNKGEFTGTYKDELYEALEASGYHNAKVVDGVVHYQRKTDEGTYVDDTAELSEQDFKEIIASQRVIGRTTDVIEFSPKIIDNLSKVWGETATKELYLQEDGGALTKTSLDQIVSYTFGTDAAVQGWDELTDDQKKNYIENDESYEGLLRAWGALGEETQQSMYGGDMYKFFDALASDFSTAINSFEKAGKFAYGFMTSSQASGYVEKLSGVENLAGGKNASSMVEDATKTLLEGQDPETQREIMGRILATDWSDKESLEKLKYDLEKNFGLENVQGYIDKLGEASFATSKLTTVVETYGELWKATERVNQSMQRLNGLQWEYNRAIEGQGGNVGEIVDQMLGEYQLQSEQYQIAYENSNDDLAKIYAQGGLNYKTDFREFVTLGANGINVDQSKIQEAKNRGEFTEEEFDKWLTQLQEQYAVSQENLEGLRKTLENIEELERQGKDAYYDLRNLTKEAILDSLQKQLDTQKETLEATKEANAQLINKIQEQIDINRQDKENEKKEQNISDLITKRAYLSADTSDQNILQLLDLDKQIAEAEEEYSNALIDQSIQQLQDSNAKAEEQRERQITLAEQSLSAYENSSEFQRHIDAQLNDMLDANENWQNTELGELLTKKFTEGMSSKEASDWAEDIGAKVALASNWQITDWAGIKGEINADLSTIQEAITSLPERFSTTSTKYKVTDEVTRLNAKGFNIQMLEDDASAEEWAEFDKYVSGLSKYMAREGDQDTLDNLWEELKALGTPGQYMRTKEAHYNLVAKGMEDRTYEEYLKDSIGDQKARLQKPVDTFVSKAQASGYDRENFTNSKEYTAYRNEYYKAGGSYEAFDQQVRDKFAVDGFLIQGVTPIRYDYWDQNSYDFAAVLDETYTNGENKGENIEIYNSGDPVGDDKKTRLNRLIPWGQVDAGTFDPSKKLAVLDNKLYMSSEYASKETIEWYEIDSNPTNPNYREGYDELKRIFKFKTGGLADFTGPAWLDGTPSKPEYILNAAQTERFFSLIDVLEGYDTDKNKKSSSGDNYFDIEINVEKIEDDYDVEQIADKIRRIIYEDATYRNVNAINHIR